MPATTTLKRGVAFHRSNLYSAANNLSISSDGMSWPARRLNKSLLNLSRPYQTLTPGTTQRIAPAVSTKLAILTEEPKTKKHWTYVDFIHKITSNPREIGHPNHKTASTPHPYISSLIYYRKGNSVHLSPELFNCTANLSRGEAMTSTMGLLTGQRGIGDTTGRRGGLLCDTFLFPTREP